MNRRRRTVATPTTPQEHAIAVALDISDHGAEPTRRGVRAVLECEGVTVDGPTLDAAIVGVLSLHGWLVECGPAPKERTSVAYRARPEQRAKSNAHCGSPF